MSTIFHMKGLVISDLTPIRSIIYLINRNTWIFIASKTLHVIIALRVFDIHLIGVHWSDLVTGMSMKPVPPEITDIIDRLAKSIT